MVDETLDVALMKKITTGVTKFLADEFPDSNLNTRINALTQAILGDLAFESATDEQMHERIARLIGYLSANKDKFVAGRELAHQAMPEQFRQAIEQRFVILNRDGVSVGPLPEDLELIMCIPVSKMPEPGHPDSVQKVCHDCNAAVWAGPATIQTANARPKARIVCDDCMVDRMKSGGVQ